MTPKIVIAGRPNVGKSALFNRLCGRRTAIVHHAPGMTLDYLSETIEIAPGCRAEVVDTGGVGGETDEWTAMAEQQAHSAMAAADVLLLVTDAKIGRHPGDAELLRRLRRFCRPCVLAVNKSEGRDAAADDFYHLGLSPIFAVSAKRGSGMAMLCKHLAHLIQSPPEESPAAAKKSPLKLAIVGRPNVGKSTLLNALLEHERTVVCARPGTTRDSVCAEYRGRHGDFILIDTAGMRRRRAEGERERLSVAAARYSLSRADVAFLLVDAAAVTYQDKRIAALIAEAGCAAVLLANKSDTLPSRPGDKYLAALRSELPFGFPAPVFAVSAISRRLPRTAMLNAARRAAAAGGRQLSTAVLNKTLDAIVRRHPPPRAGATRPKLRYAHQGGSRPVQIIVHGGAVTKIKEDYRRYLAAAFAQELSLVGAPVRIEFRREPNPYG